MKKIFFIVYKKIFAANYLLKKLLRLFFSILFSPQKCLCCGHNSYLYPICNPCIEKQIFNNLSVKKRRCKICGKPLITEQDVCTICREKPVLKSVDRVFPIYNYLLWKKDLLFEWKIKGDRFLTYLFSQIVATALHTEFNNISIVPIPPRPGKIRKVGWDQIDDLCKTLKFLCNFDVIYMLDRKNKNEQKKLHRSERLATLGKSYCAKKKLKHIPKAVVLVDDVLTTGVTLENCAKALKEIGVEQVFALVLFIV